MGSCALSPQQRALVDALPLPASDKLWTNFPYDLCRRPEAPLSYVPSPLLYASAVNALRFLAATQPLRRPSRVAAWRALKSSCDRLLLVTGSCGSQIVAALERAAPEGASVELLSLGPVDTRRNVTKQMRVVGERDRLARRSDVTVPGVGHMDYLDSEAVIDLAVEWVRERR